MLEEIAKVEKIEITEEKAKPNKEAENLAEKYRSQWEQKLPNQTAAKAESDSNKAEG